MPYGQRWIKYKNVENYHTRWDTLEQRVGREAEHMEKKNVSRETERRKSEKKGKKGKSTGKEKPQKEGGP